MFKILKKAYKDMLKEDGRAITVKVKNGNIVEAKHNKELSDAIKEEEIHIESLEKEERYNLCGGIFEKKEKDIAIINIKYTEHEIMQYDLIHELDEELNHVMKDILNL